MQQHFLTKNQILNIFKGLSQLTVLFIIFYGIIIVCAIVKGGILKLNKFLKILLIVLILFVGAVSVQFILKNNETTEQQKMEQAKAAIPPEQLKIETMNAISQIVLHQFVENIMLNMEIELVDDRQNITISLQASEFMDEDTLLKDSYNLLKEIKHVDGVNDVTLKWFMNVRSKNTEALTLTFDAKAVQSINDLSYKDLPAIATTYNKHGNVR